MNLGTMCLSSSGPEPDQKCPVIVRKVIDSVTYSHNMMEFVKTIGLRMDYEFIAKGTVWTNGKMKVVLSQIQKSEKRMEDLEGSNIEVVVENEQESDKVKSGDIFIM
uniref:Mediator of RNA polymerase II transcription subunit 18 n=1 Tax=Heterorhabditis bacteriophora TaxID=37862 RepID=A0A1I7XF68_HETBA